MYGIVPTLARHGGKNALRSGHRGPPVCDLWYDCNYYLVKWLEGRAVEGYLLFRNIN